MKSTEKRPDNAMNRRQFLRKTALAAAGAAAFPYIVPSRAFGAAGNVAPSNRISIGMIGMGMQNRSHMVNCAGHRGVQVVAFADIETVRLDFCKEFVNKAYAHAAGMGSYKGADIYTDFNELLARDDIDAVMIASPDHWHAAMAIAAARAGKDIYCEKPMTHTVEEGRAVVNAVRRYGRVFQTGSQQRSDYNCYFVRAAELVRNGVIGDLKCIDIGVSGPAIDSYNIPAETPPPTMDWNAWLGPAPYRSYNSLFAPPGVYYMYPSWRSFRDYAGGGLSDFGAHNFDIAQWALNMDGSGPVEFVHPKDRDGADKRLMMRYANGVPMYHGLDPKTPPKGTDAYCIFYGTKGTIYVNRDYVRAEPDAILGAPYGPNDVQLSRGRTHFDDFLESIKTRSKPVADVEIGHRTATICSLANMCYQIGRSFKWDPATERVVGDAEANRMLGYSYRAPWRLDV